MKVGDMFPGKYATGEDLHGKALTLTISTVKREKMRPNPASPEVEKFVIYFDGAQRGIVLSKTLAEQIAAAVGSDDTDHWPGQRVTIYPEPVTVAGVARVAIRARKAPAVQAAPEIPRIER